MHTDKCMCVYVYLYVAKYKVTYCCFTDEKRQIKDYDIDCLTEIQPANCQEERLLKRYLPSSVTPMYDVLNLSGD